MAEIVTYIGMCFYLCKTLKINKLSLFYLKVRAPEALYAIRWDWLGLLVHRASRALSFQRRTASPFIKLFPPTPPMKLSPRAAATALLITSATLVPTRLVAQGAIPSVPVGTLSTNATVVRAGTKPRVILLKDYGSIFTADVQWTMELVTSTPFGIDRLSFISFTVDLTIRVNGIIKTPN